MYAVFPMKQVGRVSWWRLMAQLNWIDQRHPKTKRDAVKVFQELWKSKYYIFKLHSRKELINQGSAEKWITHSSVFYTYWGSRGAWNGSSMLWAKGWDISWTDCRFGPGYNPCENGRTWKLHSPSSGHRMYLLWGDIVNHLTTLMPKSTRYRHSVGNS